MKKLLSTFLVMAVTVVAMFSGMSTVSAQKADATSSVCIWGGIPILKDLCGNQTASGLATNPGTMIVGVAKIILTVFFVLVIAVAIFYIMKAALKYIRSEGDEKKVEQGKQAIKSILMGVAAVFVGVIGIVFILIVFNATGVNGGDPANNLNKALDCLKGINVETNCK